MRLSPDLSWTLKTWTFPFTKHVSMFDHLMEPSCKLDGYRVREHENSKTGQSNIIQHNVNVMFVKRPEPSLELN